VIEDRQPDAKQLERHDKGETAEEFNLLGIGGRPAGGEGIGNEMFDQEQTHRNNPAQRVQAAEQK